VINQSCGFVQPEYFLVGQYLTEFEEHHLETDAFSLAGTGKAFFKRFALPVHNK